MPLFTFLTKLNSKEIKKNLIEFYQTIYEFKEENYITRAFKNPKEDIVEVVLRACCMALMEIGLP